MGLTVTEHDNSTVARSLQFCGFGLDSWVHFFPLCGVLENPNKKYDADRVELKEKVHNVQQCKLLSKSQR